MHWRFKPGATLVDSLCPGLAYVGPLALRICGLRPVGRDRSVFKNGFRVMDCMDEMDLLDEMRAREPSSPTYVARRFLSTMAAMIRRKLISRSM